MSLIKNGSLKEEKLTLLPEYDSHNPNTHDKIICDFILKETLGKGTFGVVKLAINSQTGEKVAIKIINESKIAKDQKLTFIREIEILKKLKHPNIIRLYSHISKEKQLYLITEYIKGIELYQYISLKKKLEESEACMYFQQIIIGLEYLHKMGIVHRDLKPENILVDHRLKEIKIIDFGLSNKYTDKLNLLSTLCGSPHYLAPEVLQGKGYKPRPVDIWSTGIVLYFMLCGKLPFQGDSDDDLYQKIIEAKVNNIVGISKEGNDLIKNILNPNPRKRITIANIKKHPWFNLFNNNNFININYYGLLINKYVIPIDEDIVTEMTNKFNIPEDEIRCSILKNKLNDISTLYYLIVNKKNKEGKKSISDFKSDIFINYIKNEDNLFKKYGNDINKVIKYRKYGIKEEKKILERDNSRTIKGISLEKVNFDEKKDLFRSLSPINKNSKIEYDLLNSNNKKKIQSPKSIRSFEYSDNVNTNSNFKNMRNDTEVESIKPKEKGKYKKLLIKTNTNTNKLNIYKKNILNSPENQKKQIGKHISSSNYTKNDTENKIINNKNKNNYIPNLTYNNLSSEKQKIEEENINKIEIKNKKSERKEKKIYKNELNNYKKKGSGKAYSPDEKKKLVIVDNNIILKSNERNEKEKKPILTNTEGTSHHLEPIKESRKKTKKEMIEKNITDFKINNNNNKPKKINIEEKEIIIKKCSSNETPKINDENKILFKKQNAGFLYSKRNNSKNAKNNKINSVRKGKIKNNNISSANNTNNSENSNIKNNFSVKNYLKTENIINIESPNKKINRYFSEGIFDTKDKNNFNNSNFKNKNSMIIKGKKFKENVFTNINNNLNLNIPKNRKNNYKSIVNNFISLESLDINNDIYNNNNNNGFIEPFDLNNFYFKKKGEIKKELIEKFEKKKIKLKKIGNYSFIAELKNEISFELEIKGNKNSIGNNICILKIKKIKGSNISIFNCLKKILYQ